MNIKFGVVSIVILIAAALLIYGLAPSVYQKEKINGMTLESPPAPIEAAKFDPIKNLHANYVAIVPYAFSSIRKPIVVFNDERQWWGEKGDGVKELIGMARSRGMNIMLKPHVWMERGWVGDFYPKNNDDLKLWQSAYTAYVMYYAEVAEAFEVEILCIGTEFKLVATKNPEYWIDLISQIRSVYSGYLTYAANWDEYDKITFWDQLDFIGINAYFPLSKNPSPDIQELKLAWTSIIEDIELVKKEFEKPILFTEFGYRSVEFATGNQWELDDKAVNPDIQERAFSTFFNTIWTEKWVAGGFIWKWEFDENAGGINDTKYTPQNKPAMETIKNTYRRE